MSFYLPGIHIIVLYFQGQFSMDLVGTGFIVSINTTWMLQGNEATQQIWRLRVGCRAACTGGCL